MGEYEPFGHDVGKDGAVRISRGGRTVVTVRGQAARALAAKLAERPDDEQALLQRATGNYKRGNERR